MEKLNKIKFVLVLILTLISLTSIYYPDPYSKIYIWLFLGSFFSCIIVGFSAAIRSKKLQLLHPNPIEQAKAATTTSLNKIEKIILIFAIFSLIGCFFGAIFYPVIDTIINT